MENKNKYQGLSQKKVTAKQAESGYNELPSDGSKNFFNLLKEVVSEPMIFLLLACGVLYWLLGDKGEAMLLMGSVVGIIALTIYQENKTEKTLAALRDLSSPRALVIRDGQQARIPGREVVVEDIVLLAEGDRIPADALILETVNFSVNEAILTGESLSIIKKSSANGLEETGEDFRDYYVYAGALVVKGQAVVRVVAIGEKTEMGKIGVSLKKLEVEKTFIEKQTDKIVKGFALVGLIACVVVVSVFTFVRGEWLQGLLAGLTLAMGILPEEFPVVLTVFLALGAWRIAKKKVLARRSTAVEMLGSITVLCSDKTGTLTQNKMSVQNLYAGGEIFEIKDKASSLPDKVHEIVEYAYLASPEDPFEPMEKSIRQLAKKTLVKTEHWHDDWRFVKEYPLNDKLLAMSRVWRRKEGDELIIAAKGAPEAIIDLCHLPAEETKNIMAAVHKMASDGRRVLGVAKTKTKEKDLVENQHDYQFEFVGLLGLADPIRAEAPAAIAECYLAGIRVIMITGDYPQTAMKIGSELGIKNFEEVITGDELEKMTMAVLKKRIKEVNIFARVVPEQKLKIVQALKAAGEIVAMTGDGVNDAPALKAAHIGVAMGERGTDVAREASGLVLLDDNFASIVRAVKMGRRVYDNLKKAMSYILVVHIPIILLSTVPVLLGLPLALLPAHIMFLEIVIDPACSTAFENEKSDGNIMKRPPRLTTEKIFDKWTLIKAMVRGLLTSALVVGIYIYGVKTWGIENARLVTFSSLVFTNLAFILTGRSETKIFLKTLLIRNVAMWVIVSSSIALLLIVFSVPKLSQLFGFSNLDYWHINWICLSFIGALAVGEITKFLFNGKRVS